LSPWRYTRKEVIDEAKAPKATPARIRVDTGVVRPTLASKYTAATRSTATRKADH